MFIELKSWFTLLNELKYWKITLQLDPSKMGLRSFGGNMNMSPQIVQFSFHKKPNSENALLLQERAQFLMTILAPSTSHSNLTL